MKDKYIYLILFSLFILATVLVNPMGNFPLNDDWTHTWAIANYLKTNNFIYPAWLSSHMHLPIIYGLVLSKIFGFSFTLLRFTNIFFSFLTLIIFFNICQEFKVKKVLSFLLTLVFFFNPLFFNLTYTFMGDIPALFFLLLAFYLFLLGFRINNNKFILGGSFITIFGFFIRQTNVLLLPAVLIYYLYKNKFNFQKIFILFIFPLFLLLIIYYFLAFYNLLPGQVEARFLGEGLSYFNHFFSNFYYFILLLAFFLLPLSLSLFFKNKYICKDYRFYISFFILLFFSFDYLFLDLGNIISLSGLGPSNLVLQGKIDFHNLIIYRIINSIIIFTIPLYFLFSKKIKIHFIYLFSFFYLLLILPILSFDRYLLMILPIALIYFASLLEKYNYSQFIFIFITILFAIYSTLATYNYLEWQRVRWSLADSLIKENISREDIEGGYEMNGWYLYNKDLGHENTPFWAPWYVRDISPGHQMKYIISFSPLGGYEVKEKRRANTIFSNIDYLYLNEVKPHSLEE